MIYFEKTLTVVLLFSLLSAFSPALASRVAIKDNPGALKE